MRHGTECQSKEHGENMNQMHSIFAKFRNEDDYKSFLAVADDRAQLYDTLYEYEMAVERWSATMVKEGVEVHREFISLTDMLQWLADKKLKNIGKNRVGYFAKLALKLYSEPKG
jgi:hypothetical protein